MIKSFWTLMRGASYAAEEEVLDRSALLILDQQIRDAAAAIERAKRALAVAIAQDEAEGKAPRDDARRASPTWRSAPRGARRRPRGSRRRSGRSHRHDGGRPRRHAGGARDVRQGDRAAAARRRPDASHRLAELERGRRIAQAAEAVRRLQHRRRPPASPAPRRSPRPKPRCRRLRERQAEDAAADAAFETLDVGSAGTSIADRLEAAGFGRRTKPTAASVLERLRATMPTQPVRPTPTATHRSSCHEPASRSTHALVQPGSPSPMRASSARSAWSPPASFCMPLELWIKGYFAMGDRHADPVLRHRHQDHPRRAREQQAREPDRGRQGRAAAHGHRAGQGLR